MRVIQLNKERKAFSMMMAISVIVMMSTLSILVMSLSAKMIQNTTAQYQREQAILLAKSYTEFAIMSVMSNQRTVQCIDTITGVVGSAGADTNGQGYRVRIQIGYIGRNADNNLALCSRVINNAVSASTRSKLNVIIDVYIDYKDINNPDIPHSQWLTYHRRTLQKI